MTQLTERGDMVNSGNPAVTKAPELVPAQPNGTLSMPSSCDVSSAAVQTPPTEAEIARLRAQVVTRPGFNSSLIVAEYAQGLEGEVKLGDLIHDFIENVDKIWGGDLKQAEAMLFAQAQALQSMFVYTARQARHADKLHHQDMLMRMAMKAQAQCRATLETLANIKNPPVVFARQANINAGGQQQVNNGTAAPAIAAHAAVPSPEANRTIRRKGSR